MGDNDTAVATVRKVPAPKPMSPMPRDSVPEGERAMPLTHQFHVMDISPAKGGSKKRPVKGDPMKYMKARQTDEAYKGGVKPVMKDVDNDND